MSDLLFIPFQAYVKDLCEKHADVLHVDGSNRAFIRMQSDEDIQSIPQDASTMLVIVSNFVGRATGGRDTGRLRQNASLMFLKRAGINPADPAQAVQDAQDFAMSVMFDFYSRMKFDMEEDSCGPLQFLMLDLMSFMPVDGPILEEHYGWEMTIPFDAFAPAYNPAKWSDTP